MALSDEDQAFQAELTALPATVVTDEVTRRDRESGENSDETVHLAQRALGLGRPSCPSSNGVR